MMMMMNVIIFIMMKIMKMMKCFVCSKMVADYYHDFDMIMLVILIMIKTMRMMMMMIIFIIMKIMRMMRCFVCSKMVVDSVSLNSWLHMWARMCQGAAGIDDFPIWVQLIPRVIFNVICSKEGGEVISRSSLRNFYENFTGLSGDTLDKVATEGFRSMTANGDYEP